MISDKFPPNFSFQQRGVVIDEGISRDIPSFEELTRLAAYLVDIRERYRPITNYDISGRSSRGLFIGIPDSGIEAFNFINNNGFCEVGMCTFSNERRSSVSRNCYRWGCESKLNLTSLTTMDALTRWYSVHSVMTPMYLDVLHSIPSLNVEVNQNVISINSVDLKLLLEKALEVGVPFICLRISKDNEELIRSYNLSLQVFDVNTSLNPTYLYVTLVPPIRQLSSASLTYPGELQLPTILSQKQFKTIWSIGGELKSRTEQWICKECPNPLAAAKLLHIINEMVNSDDPSQQQDSAIYSRLYQALFPPVEETHLETDTANKESIPVDAVPLVQTPDVLEEQPLELDFHSNEDQNRYEEEKQKQFLKERAQSRVRDFKAMLPDYPSSRNSIRDYLDIGCADGSITIAIGQALFLSSHHIFGCDVRDLPPEDEKSTQFLFQHYDGTTLPYCNNCFDVITVFMVLHHIPEISQFLKEICRVMRNDGILIIREHDCDPETMRLFLDVQHGMYALSLQRVIESPDFCTTFQTYFRSRDEWNSLLLDAGLSPVTEGSYRQDKRKDFYFLSGGSLNRTRPDGSIRNLLKSYYAVYRKTTHIEESTMRGNRYETIRERNRERNRDRDRDRDRDRNRDRDRDRSRRYR